MIPTLIIEMAAPSEYFVEVRCEHSVFQVYSAASIHEAIDEAATLIQSAHAFHIWFEHVSIGTTPVINMRRDAETLANRLMQLHGQFR